MCFSRPTLWAHGGPAPEVEGLGVSVVRSIKRQLQWRRENLQTGSGMVAWGSGGWAAVPPGEAEPQAGTKAAGPLPLLRDSSMAVSTPDRGPSQHVLHLGRPKPGPSRELGRGPNRDADGLSCRPRELRAWRR